MNTVLAVARLEMESVVNLPEKILAPLRYRETESWSNPFCKSRCIGYRTEEPGELGRESSVVIRSQPTAIRIAIAADVVNRLNTTIE